MNQVEEIKHSELGVFLFERTKRLVAFSGLMRPHPTREFAKLKEIRLGWISDTHLITNRILGGSLFAQFVLSLPKVKEQFWGGSADRQRDRPWGSSQQTKYSLAWFVCLFVCLCCLTACLLCWLFVILSMIPLTCQSPVHDGLTF